MTARRGFGVYVHWPFCQAKCPYCDFNSHVVDDVDQSVWADAFESEIARVQQDMPDATLDTVFLGGGTPSLMTPDTVDRILRKLRATWPASNDLEITLEANPTSVEASRFQAYAQAGISRVSVGVQALNDGDLRRLGRLHSVSEARAALTVANKFFDRVSFDLIYARQDQNLHAWERELAEAIELSTGHLSLYQLTIEPGTAFGARFDAGRLHGLPDEDLAADMFALTQDITSSAGLKSYEISNHAKPGAESRHNLIYWRGHDWVGVGPGAHGRFTKDGKRVATETHLSPVAWLEAVKAGNGESKRTYLSEREALDERVMMGLRLSEGIDLPSDQNIINKINALVDLNLLKIRNARVATTAQGKLVLNAILRELLA